MLAKLKQTYREFPAAYWVLAGCEFIDTVGGTLIFPFFALYVTQRFGVGMTQAGILLGVFSLSELAGGMVGGAITDKVGRRGVVIFGTAASALSTLAMGFVGEMVVFYPLAVIVGLLGGVGRPAREAIVADLLPEEQRAEGYGIIRVGGNLAWIIGPSIGGLMATRSYLALFIADAVLSCLVAFIVYKMIPETRPAAAPGQAPHSLWQTVLGYRLVLRDRLFMAFLLASMLMLLVYGQLYSTLAVYLRDAHGISAQGYGFLISVNAGLVVLLQLWISRRIKALPPLLMMAVGTAFYLVGFTMFGLVVAYALFAAAIILITLGEMIVVPVSQALVARFAPEDMRGRYMAVSSLSWAIPNAVGPWAAGLILDNYNPNWVWYAGGIVCAVALAGFYALHLRTERHAVPVATAG